MLRATLTAIVALAVIPASADNFTYACKDHGKRSVLRIDDAKHTPAWRGKTYAIKDAKEGDCPRFGWNVTGKRKSFDFLHRDTGHGYFHLDGHDVQCDQKS